MTREEKQKKKGETRKTIVGLVNLSDKKLSCFHTLSKAIIIHVIINHLAQVSTSPK